ncbi:nuclear transport factor 2 family protein [Actinokineospora sp. NPDC004072]
MSLLETVRAHYAASERGDLAGMLAPLSEESRWVEAAGSEYAGVYVGPDAVRAGVFERIGAEWESFEAVVESVVDGGDVVVALGEYRGVRGGRSVVARFAHVWRVEGGVVSFEQVADTALLNG